mgnify:CR=1 FL=1
MKHLYLFNESVEVDKVNYIYRHLNVLRSFISSVFPKDICNILDKCYSGACVYKNNIQNFLVSKDLLLSIIDTLLLKKTKSITTNYKLMVMHDGNITPMIRLLAGEQAIDEGKFPDFNASIRFELIEENDDFCLHILFLNFI